MGICVGLLKLNLGGDEQDLRFAKLPTLCRRRASRQSLTAALFLPTLLVRTVRFPRVK